MTKAAYVGVPAAPGTSVRNQQERHVDPDDVDVGEFSIGLIAHHPWCEKAVKLLFDRGQEVSRFVAPGARARYFLATIHTRKVVLAGRPEGAGAEYPASSIARETARLFPNLRIRIVIGLGAGVPGTSHDIRLGDVVVGTDGVWEVGSDHKAWSLDSVLPCVRDAVRTIPVDGSLYMRESVRDILTLNRVTMEDRARFARPDNQTDPRYWIAVVHGDSQRNRSCLLLLAALPCVACFFWGLCSTMLALVGTLALVATLGALVASGVCGHGREHARALLCIWPRGARHGPSVSRESPRDPTQTRVHHGRMASTDRPVRDAMRRDELAREQAVLCFATETAGSDEVPCVVVRGICDYADGLCNSPWQPHAAMVASVFARKIVAFLPMWPEPARRPGNLRRPPMVAEPHWLDGYPARRRSGPSPHL